MASIGLNYAKKLSGEYPSLILNHSFLISALQHNQSGALPRWPIASVEAGCMTGSHGVVILTDAVLKGVPGINGKLQCAAYEG